MPGFRPLLRSLVITAALIAADLSWRVVFGFDMKRVTVFEAILFAVACLFFLWTMRSDRAFAPIAARIEMWLAVLFGLGSLRAGLWSAGLPVSVANIVTFGVFLL